MRAIKWIGAGLLALAALAVLLFAWSRLSGPSDTQREALALIENAAPATGDNAFDLLWLMPYDIPADERAAVVEADLARYRQQFAAGDESPPVADSRSTAEGRYPRVSDDEPAYCGLRETACLAKVREQSTGYADRLARDAALLARARELAQNDHYRSRFPPGLQMPFPEFHRVAVSLTGSALDFVEGRVDAALDAACTDVLTWRRLGAYGDSLIVVMIAAAMVEGNAALVADMLAELPLDHPLPAACATAFDPETIAPDLCPSMIGEARWAFSVMQDTDTGGPLQSLLFDPARTRALAAPGYVYVCSGEFRRKLREDAALDLPPVEASMWRLECVGNFLGCALQRIATPAYADYPRRVQDMQAMLGVVDTLWRLRSEADGPALQIADVEAALAARPATSRPIRLDAEHGELQIKLRGSREADSWRAPLPASRWAAGEP